MDLRGANLVKEKCVFVFKMIRTCGSHLKKLMKKWVWLEEKRGVVRGKMGCIKKCVFFFCVVNIEKGVDVSPNGFGSC